MRGVVSIRERGTCASLILNEFYSNGFCHDISFSAKIERSPKIVVSYFIICAINASNEISAVIECDLIVFILVRCRGFDRYQMRVTLLLPLQTPKDALRVREVILH